MILACHCGAVQVEVPVLPSVVNNCNCSICRRYGVLWAYYPASQVRVLAAPDATDGYVWGRKVLRFVRCRNCGCVTHWERIEPVGGSKMGVNARNLEAGVLEGVPIEQLDGASG
jgi:hypothetical protein